MPILWLLDSNDEMLIRLSDVKSFYLTELETDSGDTSAEFPSWGVFADFYDSERDPVLVKQFGAYTDASKWLSEYRVLLNSQS